MHGLVIPISVLFRIHQLMAFREKSKDVQIPYLKLLDFQLLKPIIRSFCWLWRKDNLISILQTMSRKKFSMFVRHSLPKRQVLLKILLEKLGKMIRSFTIMKLELIMKKKEFWKNDRFQQESILKCVNNKKLLDSKS